MIDAHCHILPGLDDGADSIDESISIAREAVTQGINTVWATPHFIPGESKLEREKVLNATENLNKALAKENVNLNIIPGMEVFFTDQLPDLVSADIILTINDSKKFLLVELPLADAPIYTEEILFRLLLKGVTPIIAHPERNLSIQKNTEWAMKLVNQGVLLQVNAGSLLGFFGPKVKAAAEALLKKGIIHLLGSDTHSANGRRAMSYNMAVEKIIQAYGEEYAEIITKENPMRVAEGKELRASMVNVRKQRRFAINILAKLKGLAVKS